MSGGKLSKFFILTLFFYLPLIPGQNKKPGNITGLKKANYFLSFSRININKISTFIYNNGVADLSSKYVSGFVYPKGTGKTAVFESGLMWAGKVDGQIRACGSTYGSGLQPGKIISQGIAENPDDPSVRVYRVRPDYKTSLFTSEINDGEGTREEIKARYEKDWNEWPADKGAPFVDKNGDGIYEPDVDVPGVNGAGQTLWFVANDLNSTLTNPFYGSPPIGIEMQVTVWGYNVPTFENMIFKKYKLINKSGKDITDMYLSMWSDPDLGDATDDFAGCDTLLNLGYVYNAYDHDNVYDPLPPPAVGFALVQGPVINGTLNDTAHVDGRIIPGKKNLGMTSFYYFAGGDPILGDPPLGNNYEGTIEWYNYMRAKYGISGDQFKYPAQFGGGPTNYLVPGDPVTGSGWVDGISLPHGDRRIGSSSGPFNIAPLDTQEVVFAEICAGAEPSIDRLQAIEVLRQYAAFAAYYNELDSPVPPSVSSSALDQKIVLNWGSDLKGVEETENQSQFLDKFHFEGYNLYQYSSDDTNKAQGVRIATFDLVDGVKEITDIVHDSLSGAPVTKVVQFGTDSGIKRYFVVDKDYLTNLPLHNGSKYYFAVTAYSYNSDPHISPRSIESKPEIFTVIPHSPNPGVRYGAPVGTELTSVHSQGSSGGNVRPVVIDPALLNGHSYKVTFKVVNSDTLWDLTDNTTQTLKLQNQKNQSGDDDYLIVDGLMVKVVNSNKLNTPADVFTFTAPETTGNDELAKQDVKEINIFPNPYYSVRDDGYVTFSHLPEKATIRIYDLSGWLVKTIEKDGTDQFYRYDLRNNSNALIGSGVYVAFVDMPALGTTRVVKFTVIQ